MRLITMRVVIFTLEEHPLPDESAGTLESTLIFHKDHRFRKYKVDFTFFLERAHSILGNRYIKDIPILIYILGIPKMVKLTNEYKAFSNLHILNAGTGYYINWLICNNKYFKPSTADILYAPNLLVEMYSEYKSNKLLESL